MGWMDVLTMLVLLGLFVMAFFMPLHVMALCFVWDQLRKEVCHD